MSASIRAGDFRVCPYCASRNKGAHRYCVRCSAPLQAAGAAALPVAVAGHPMNTRVMRFALAAGVMAAVAFGLFLLTVSRATREVGAISEDVRADSARTVTATPIPPVTGWYPGANVPVEPDTAPTWSTSSFPVARPNPYDVPGDPATSMVGIAPRAPRERAAMARKRVFTDDDLLATRGGAWAAPPVSREVTERESKLSVAESRLQTAQARLAQARAQRGGAADDDHVREAIKQAADDLEDAREDAATAQRKLQEARREN